VDGDCFHDNNTRILPFVVFVRPSRGQRRELRWTPGPRNRKAVGRNGVRRSTRDGYLGTTPRWRGRDSEMARQLFRLKCFTFNNVRLDESCLFKRIKRTVQTWLRQHVVSHSERNAVGPFTRVLRVRLIAENPRDYGISFRNDDGGGRAAVKFKNNNNNSKRSDTSGSAIRPDLYTHTHTHAHTVAENVFYNFNNNILKFINGHMLLCFNALWCNFSPVRVQSRTQYNKWKRFFLNPT